MSFPTTRYQDARHIRTMPAMPRITPPVTAPMLVLDGSAGGGKVGFAEAAAVIELDGAESVKGDVCALVRAGDIEVVGALSRRIPFFGHNSLAQQLIPQRIVAATASTIFAIRNWRVVVSQFITVCT